MSHILGVSAGFHDAAVSVIDRSGNILFATHSERYSRLKNDSGISPDLQAVLGQYSIDVVAWYERPWLHNLQQWVSAQKKYGPWTTRGAVQHHLGMDVRDCRSYGHHLSHAAAGFQTSPYRTEAIDQEKGLDRGSSHGGGGADRR